MLLSFAIMLLSGLVLGEVFKRISLPPLLGMMLAGILIGPHVFNVIDESVLNISLILREIALVIILTRAGLSINIKELKKIGRPAFLLSFVPACLEIVVIAVLAPILFNISLVDSVLMGAVVAAVSPAVIVPKMLHLIETGYGKEKAIAQMILAASSVDDVFVIAVFSAVATLAVSGSFSVISFVGIPINIVLGVLVGLALGLVLGKIFTRYSMRDTVKIIVIMSLSFVLLSIEDKLSGVFSFSSLIAIMSLGITLQKFSEKAVKRLVLRYNQLWVGAQIMLFVLVGASVSLDYVLSSGFMAVVLILVALLIRMLAVLLCLIGSKLNKKERAFCMFAYMPKATVQAAIGGVPLAMGIGSGEIILTVAAVSILISAPLGALIMDLTYKKLLEK